MSEVTPSESGEARSQPKNPTPGLTLLITALLLRKKCNNLISMPMNESCDPVSHTGKKKSHPCPRTKPANVERGINLTHQRSIK